MVEIIKTVITPNPGHGVSQDYTLLDQMSGEEYHLEICTLSVSDISDELQHFEPLLFDSR